MTTFNVVGIDDRKCMMVWSATRPGVLAPVKGTKVYMTMDNFLSDPRFAGIESFKTKAWLSSPTMHGGGQRWVLTVGGGGRKSKTAGIEDDILVELEQGDYYTRQQIADMIREKFHISVSPSVVGRLLKKTGSEN